MAFTVATIIVCLAPICVFSLPLLDEALEQRRLRREIAAQDREFGRRSVRPGR